MHSIRQAGEERQNPRAEDKQRRNQTRRDGLRQLFKKVVCTDAGLEEQWVTTDEFYREYNQLVFTVQRV